VNPFQSLRDYETYVYTLPEQHSCILSSTLVLAQRGLFFAELRGEVLFSRAVRLIVYERIVWETGLLAIEGYSYEVWRGGEKLYWYDSQPHPNDPTLASTAPHHKHIPPDIKHHRVLAISLSFTRPNLPVLIDEIETTVLQK